MMKRVGLPLVAIFALVFAVSSAVAQSVKSAEEIDKAVIAKLSALYGSESEVISHIELKGPFGTKTQWTFVAAKETDKQDDMDEDPGAVSLCFVRNGVPDCSEAPYRAKYKEINVSWDPKDRLFGRLRVDEIVFATPDGKSPLLMIQTCTAPAMNGNCGITTMLYSYNLSADKFDIDFFNLTGKNQNEATRFIKSGPLQGSIISDVPTGNAPFTYFVEVHQKKPSGKYAQVLRYRGKTGYGDGNPLAVIDSEMPEILRRLGFWKVGDALPIPPTMPDGCTKLSLRKGVEWCQ